MVLGTAEGERLGRSGIYSSRREMVRGPDTQYGKSEMLNVCETNKIEENPRRPGGKNEGMR